MNFGKSSSKDKGSEENNYGTTLAQAGELGKKAMNSQPVRWGRWELERIKTLALENSGDSLKMKNLSFAAGVAMCSCGFMGVFTYLFDLSLHHAIIELYVLVFGIVSLIVDAQGVLCPPNRAEAIKKYAKFMFTLWGKGLFYLFAGSLMIAQWSMMDVLVGFYVGLLGFFMLFNGYNVHKKLGNLKNHREDDATLRKRFQEYDENHNGALDGEEIAKLAKSLGSELTAAELEAFAEMIPKGRDGKVHYEQFLAWWKGPQNEEP